MFTIKEKIYWSHNWSHKKALFKEALKSILFWAAFLGGLSILVTLLEKLFPFLWRFVVSLIKFVFNQIVMFADALNNINPKLGMIVFFFIVGSFVGLYLWWIDNKAKEGDENV